MSRASELASARGEAHSARHSAIVAREKLRCVTIGRDKLREEVARLTAELADARREQAALLDLLEDARARADSLLVELSLAAESRREQNSSLKEWRDGR